MKSIIALLLPHLAAADIGNVFPPTPVVSTITARHVVVSVPVNTPTVVRLYCENNDGDPMEYYISKLPSVEQGHVYETSQNYRSAGMSPVFKPLPIGLSELPFKVTDVENQVVFIPADNAYANVDMWATFNYYCSKVGDTLKSDNGMAAMGSPQGAIAMSTFSSDTDGWYVEGNGALREGELKYEPYQSSELINRYLYIQDDVQYFQNDGHDSKLFYFVAPPKFLVPAMATAYKGFLKFDIKASFGVFGTGLMNHGAPLVVMECQECDSGRGMRLVYPLEESFWDGSETTISIPFDETKGWKRDPLNEALEMMTVDECEMFAVMQALTKFSILGDYIRAQEGIMIDNIRVEHPTSSGNTPTIPRSCQQGSDCKHLEGTAIIDAKRITCHAQPTVPKSTYHTR